MRTINKVLIGTVLGAAGLTTVGAGAGASFLDTPSTTQSIDSGTLLFSVTSGGVTSTATNSTPAEVALAALSNEASNSKNYKEITVTNTGTLPGTVNSIALAATGDTSTLGSHASQTVTYSAPGKTSAQNTQLCSGTIAFCTGRNIGPAGGFVVTPGQSYIVQISTYAGGNTGAPALTNVDEGKSLNETLTETISNTDSTH